VQAIIYDNATTCELRNHFLADLEDAVEVTPDYWAKRPTVSKIMEPIAKLLAPLF
jgi:hypothetical protein